MLRILEMSFSGSILIFAIIIIRRLVLHKLPKKTFLILWSVALCRLLIPFSISSRFNIYTLMDTLKTKVWQMVTPGIVRKVSSIGALPIHVTNKRLLPFVLIWMIGMLTCALYFLVAHLRCRKEYKTALPINNDFISRWVTENWTGRKAQIKQSDKITTPLTYGIFRPVILLPKAMEWTDETTLSYILTHEFVHIQHFDTLAKLLLATALCIHWFNPFAWMMHMLFNHDIEHFCDETVIRIFGETEKAAYAMALINLEETRSNWTPFINNFGKNAIKERIVSIVNMKEKSFGSHILAFSLVIGTVTVFGTSAMVSRSFTEVTISDIKTDVLITFDEDEIYNIEKSPSLSLNPNRLHSVEMEQNIVNKPKGATKEVEIQEGFLDERIIFSKTIHLKEKEKQ